MHLLLILSFMYCSFDCYSSDLVANDPFSSTLSIQLSVSDTIVPGISLPEGVEKIEYEVEEKKYRSWVKLSLASSWVTLVFLSLAILFNPLWGALCVVTIIFSIVEANEVLRETKRKPMFRKVREWAKLAKFIPILYTIAAIIRAINLVSRYLNDVI
jgi:hypothetical protein